MRNSEGLNTLSHLLNKYLLCPSWEKALGDTEVECRQFKLCIYVDAPPHPVSYCFPHQKIDCGLSRPSVQLL